MEDREYSPTTIKKENLIILYSGGSDSRLMLELAVRSGKTPYCVLIDYGQLHLKELDFAREQLDKNNINHHTVKISNLNVNSGLTGNGVVNETGTVHTMHMPGRNTIFLGIAFSVAESKGIDTIWHGADWSDRLNLFPDCYQEYFVRVNEMFKYAGPKPIKVEAPIMGMPKEMVMEILKFFNIKEDELFSGYGGL